MKQFKNLLFTFVIASLIPISLVGQDRYSTQHAIDQVDVKIQNTISQRKANHENQEKINAFVNETDKWVKASSDIQNKINQARSHSGNYSSFNSNQLQQEIQNLEQQKKAINSLNGGITVDWKRYNSISELKNGLTEKSQEIVKLINEDEKLKKKLHSLDIERDSYVKDGETDERTNKKNLLWNKIQYLKRKLPSLKGDYNKASQDKINPAMWCVKKDNNSSLKCLHRNLYIEALTKGYVKSLDRDGKTYDPNELATLIKNAQRQSNAVKEEAKYMLREWHQAILSVEREIATLENRYWEEKEEDIDIDPSGCWVIVIGKDNYPKIRIEENLFGEYIAKLTDPGSLHENYKRGKILFNISRINATTFEGTEYSFSKSGATTRIPLRIIIQKDRRGIQYRTSDDILNLRPCW